MFPGFLPGSGLHYNNNNCTFSVFLVLYSILIKISFSLSLSCSNLCVLFRSLLFYDLLSFSWFVLSVWLCFVCCFFYSLLKAPPFPKYILFIKNRFFLLTLCRSISLVSSRVLREVNPTGETDPHFFLFLSPALFKSLPFAAKTNHFLIDLLCLASTDV